MSTRTACVYIEEIEDVRLAENYYTILTHRSKHGSWFFPLFVRASVAICRVIIDVCATPGGLQIDSSQLANARGRVVNVSKCRFFF